jgi:hypothetical protein
MTSQRLSVSGWRARVSAWPEAAFPETIVPNGKLVLLTNYYNR